MKKLTNEQMLLVDTIKKSILVQINLFKIDRLLFKSNKNDDCIKYMEFIIKYIDEGDIEIDVFKKYKEKLVAMLNELVS
jgi:hypothetical protein